MVSTEFEYELLTATSAYTLDFEVNLRIREGWRPFGGPCSHGGQIVQAMVRDRESAAELKYVRNPYL